MEGGHSRSQTRRRRRPGSAGGRVSPELTADCRISRLVPGGGAFALGRGPAPFATRPAGLVPAAFRQDTSGTRQPDRTAALVGRPCSTGGAGDAVEGDVPPPEAPPHRL